MIRAAKLMCGLALLVFTASVSALGLGEIDVHTHLNQRFSAEIPFTSVLPADIDSLQVGLAEPADFARAGVERADYLNSLNFEVRSDGGHPRIIVTSSEIAHEPVLSLIVQVRWHGGGLLREFTVLLDPPPTAAELAASQASGQAVPEAAAPAARYPVASTPASNPYPVADTGTQAPVASSPPKKPTRGVGVVKPAPAAETPPAASAASAYGGGSSYGPIKPAQTLWSTAKELLPPGVTMDQELLALYKSNPAAFVGGIQGLQKGSILHVPTADEATATDPATASREVAELRHVPVPQSAPAPAKPPVEARKPKAPPEPSPVVEKAPVEVAPPPAAKQAEPAPKPAEVAPPPPAVPPVPAPTVDSTAPPAAPAPAASAPEVTPSQAPAPVAEAPPAETPPATAPAPAPIPAEAPTSTPAYEEGPGLVIAGILVLLVGAVGFFFWRGYQKRKADEREDAAITADVAPRTPPISAWRAEPTAPVAEAAIPEAAEPAPEAEPEAAESLAAEPEQAPPVAVADEATKSLLDADFDLAGDDLDLTGGDNAIDVNDPLSEADFHLAYGLHDEATTILTQAIAKQPERKDLKLKLAEVYHAAGKPVEFTDTAAQLKDVASPLEWEKLAEMGRQMNAGEWLFGQSHEAAAPSLEFPEPTQPGTIGGEADTAFAFAPEHSEEAPHPSPIETGFGDIGLEDFAPAPEPISADAASSHGAHLLDFDADVLPPPPSQTQEPEGLAQFDKLETVEFDLTDFDLAEPHADDQQAPTHQVPFEPEVTLPPEMPGSGPMDSGFDMTPGPDGAPPAHGEMELAMDDEIGTKLDLARAYADMGDNEAALGLLHEVDAAGTPAQKQEAAALIQRLSV